MPHTPPARSPKPRLARASPRAVAPILSSGYPPAPSESSPRPHGSFETPRRGSQGSGVAKSSASWSQYLERERPAAHGLLIPSCRWEPAASDPLAQFRLLPPSVPRGFRVGEAGGIPASRPFPVPPRPRDKRSKRSRDPSAGTGAHFGLNPPAQRSPRRPEFCCCSLPGPPVPGSPHCRAYCVFLHPPHVAGNLPGSEVTHTYTHINI